MPPRRAVPPARPRPVQFDRLPLYRSFERLHISNERSHLLVAQLKIRHMALRLYRCRIFEPSKQIRGAVGHGPRRENAAACDMREIGTDGLVPRKAGDRVAVQARLVLQDCQAASLLAI